MMHRYATVSALQQRQLQSSVHRGKSLALSSAFFVVVRT